MNYGSIIRALGLIILVLAISLLVPGIFAVIKGSSDIKGFALSLVIGIVVGGGLAFGLKSKKEISHRDGFAVVTFGWIFAAVLGGLPYFFSGAASFTDAFFESISGFTTTGASIFTNIEGLPQATLLWRSMTHWFGGMGIIVLSIAILPYLDIGGMSIFEAEVPGPTAEKLTPRIQDTAKILWFVYFVLTIVLVILLWFAGMTVFDSVNHAFATMATGGFSTKNTSVAAFHSPLIEWILTVFMIVAGTNFSLHYRYLFKNLNLRGFAQDSEFKFYALLILIATTLITLSVYLNSDKAFFDVLRDAMFTIASIMTTTGFATADYELWNIFPQFVLMFLMLVGGCAGSTGGGIKVVRILLVFKYMYVQLLTLIHPSLVKNVKMRQSTVEEKVLASILGFIFAYTTVLMISILVVSTQVNDMMTAIGSVVASLGNIGPGFGAVGPTENYAHLSDLAKWVLSLDMIMGRLEILTVLILFLPQLWKK